MLTQRYDYKTITIPYDMQINGKVMPERLNEEEEPKLLYGEDICWLSERMNRWIMVSGMYGYSYDKNTVIDKRIIGKRYQNIIDWMSRSSQDYGFLSGKFMNPNTTWDAFYEFRLEDSPGNAPADFNPNCALSSSVFEANRDDFATGQPLKYEPISALFNDFTKWNSVQTQYYTSGLGNYGYSVDNHDSHGYVPSRKQPQQQHVFYLFARDGGEMRKSGSGSSEVWYWYPDWGWKAWYLGDAPTNDALFEVPQNALQFLGDAAIAFIKLIVSVSFHTTQYDRYTGYQKKDSRQWMYFCPIQCEKSDNGYIIPYSSIRSCTNQIIQRRGLSNPDPGGYSSDGSKGIYDADISISSEGWGIVSLNDEMDYTIE